MKYKAITGAVLTVLMISMLTLAFNIQRTESSKPPATEWTSTYSGYDALSVIQTSDGGYALAGITWSSENSYDFWLVKTDDDGNQQWNKTYGGANPEWAYSVVETGDEGYALTGFTRSFGAGDANFWLVKVDSSGNIEWNTTYGGSNDDAARSIVKTSDGGYALTGETKSLGAGGSDFWLVKTDGYGTQQWNTTYGGATDDDAFSVIQTSDGGYALAGYTTSFGVGESDFWLVKVDSSGNMEWNTTYGGANDEWAYSVVKTSDGGYALAGYTTSFGVGESDFWLVKTDGYGNQQWNKTYGGVNSDDAYSVVGTSDGGYALTGKTESFGAGKSDFWLVKVDSSGNMEWNTTYGGTNDDAAHSVIETSDGGYALCGYTWSFETGTAEHDAWLVKVAGPSVNQFGLPVPYIALASIIIVAVVAAVFIVKRRKKTKLGDQTTPTSAKKRTQLLQIRFSFF
jgi:predicted secreted protein